MVDVEKKYKLTEETIEIWNIPLHRIVALRDFADVKKGEVGGYIASEDNLSHEGNAWVYDDARVYGNAKVFENAKVSGKARVYNNAQVGGDAWICDNAQVCCEAQVWGNAVVSDNAKVVEKGWVAGNALVYGYACVGGGAWINSNARVYDRARVLGSAQVCGDAWVYGNAFVYGKSQVYDNAQVYGDVCLHGEVQVCGGACVCKSTDYVVFKNWWSSGRYFTWTRSNDMWAVGCFYGTGEELIKKAYEDSKESGDNYKAIVEYVNNVVKPQSDEEEKNNERKPRKWWKFANIHAFFEKLKGKKFESEHVEDVEQKQEPTHCCGDDRFEIIAKAKKHLMDATNIEMSPDEMKVIDNFLFRCWQMGWINDNVH